MHKQLLQVLREDVGPFRPLVSAIFYGHSSLALAYADRPDLEIIPDVNICGYQQASEIQLLRHNKRPYPPGSSCMFNYKAFCIKHLIFYSEALRRCAFPGVSQKYLTFSKGLNNNMRRRTYYPREAGAETRFQPQHRHTFSACPIHCNILI